MSSRRTSVAERYAKNGDFYATPAWVTEAVLPKVAPHMGTIECDVLDPCAGDGAILRAMRNARDGGHDGMSGSSFRGIEIDHGRTLECQNLRFPCECADALDPMVAWGGPEVIIMNPPFALAQEFVERAIQEVAHGGIIVALLRLAFLESQKRIALHNAHLSSVFVLPKRPSFLSTSKTDSSAYAWFVWGPGYGGTWSILDLPGDAS